MTNAAGTDGVGDCPASFNPNAAHQVYVRLLAHKGRDGCRLEDVKTERARMEVVWKDANGETLPAIVVEPRDCRSGAKETLEPFVVTTPSDVALACPDAVLAVQSAVREADSPKARVEETFAFRNALVAWAVILLLFVGVGLVALRALRRGTGRAARLGALGR